jgi:urease accessory protein
LKHLAACILLLAAAPAFGHSGHDAVVGFAAGLAHPVSGLDHLLAMLGIGLWSRRQDQPLALPLTFIAMMAAGALLQTGWPLPESVLAMTVVVVGMLVAAVRLPAGAALLVVGAFALLHGQAHGRELPDAESMAGYLVTSALLLMAGRQLGRPRVLGALIGAAGLCLFVGVA